MNKNKCPICDAYELVHKTGKYNIYDPLCQVVAYEIPSLEWDKCLECGELFLDDKAMNIIQRIKYNKDELKRWHHLLIKWIKKIGTKNPKKHGSYWNVTIGNFTYLVDDYNYALSLFSFNRMRFCDGNRGVDFYVGLGFGGFKTNWDLFQYKYHLGLVYKEWLRRKK